MIPELTASEFGEFFREVHGQKPFPWQERLMGRVAEPREGDEGPWPRVLDLPTGFGKTAALDVAVFHLALEANRGAKRRAPVRIALVVDRRLVVDDAFERAKRIGCKLKSAPSGTVTSKVAARLQLLAGDGHPTLVAARLRGGIPREDDWARTPSQPTIVCSTVDQIGSRLLFRGYGVSDSMKPVHAGLIGADCLILLDEAHLSEPFRQTLQWVNGYKGHSWREGPDAAPWSVALLTATPGVEAEACFRPGDEDYAGPILRLRWEASKPACLVNLAKTRKEAKGKGDAVQQPGAEEQEKHLIANFADQTLKALNAFADWASHPAIGVVVNRVARARAVFEELKKRLSDAGNGEFIAEIILLIGPARPADREVAARRLAQIRTGVERNLDKPLVIVATQCIEAGVDIDLDGLITDAVPLDALRQRFGRLNRNGRAIAPYAAIIGTSKSGKHREDPIYGEAIGQAWDYLVSHSDEPATEKSDAKVDLGLKAFAGKLAEFTLPREALAPRLDAPVLLPAHIDLLSQTSPIPNADPEIALYLHGPNRTADAITVVWREDVAPSAPDIRTRRLLLLVPPRSAESIELPVWAVRRWLMQPRAGYSELTDIPGPVPDETHEGQSRRVFLWAGDDDKSSWIKPGRIRPGSTIIVPAAYGGVDEWGWNPHAAGPATDVADKAAEAFVGRRFPVRVSPQLFDDAARERLADAIAENSTGGWQDLRDAVMETAQAEAQRLRSLDEKGQAGAATRADRLEAVAKALQRLDGAKKARKLKGKDKVECDTEVYGEDEQGRKRGVVFVAPRGIRGGEQGEALDSQNSTEDDFAGSLPGFAQSLEDHCKAVESETAQFARCAGLPEDRIADLQVAAYLHDAGKADARFQSWLAWEDPWGPDSNQPSEILAKSGRWLPRQARTQSGLPEKWRHEAFSVRLADHTLRFGDAKDQDLVLWLIGTHHGHGRPLFPHADPADAAETRTDLPNVLGIPETLAPGPGPQSLAWDRDGLDWPGLYEHLKARYGIWELARMEAILRLADHRASEKAAKEEASE